MAAEKSRCCALDDLRFLSFGCIIFYHMVVQLWMDGIRDGLAVQPFFSNANIHIATLGVNLFFMISGAGLMLSGRENFSVRRYYLKRFTRILVPFYVVWLLYFLVKLAVSRPVFPAGIPAWRIVFTLLGMDEYWHMAGIETFTLGIGEWFLGCIMLMFLIFPLLRKAVLSHPALTLCIATVYYLLMVTFYPFTEIPVNMNFFTRIYPFLFGMVLGSLQSRRMQPDAFSESGTRRILPRQVLFVTLPVIAVFLVLPVSIPLSDEYKGMIFSVCVFLTFFALEDLLAKPVRLNRFLQTFSLYSYEIFLVHHVIIFLVTGFFAGKYLSVPAIVLVFAAEAAAMAFGGWIVKKICTGLFRLCRRLAPGKQ